MDKNIKLSSKVTSFEEVQKSLQTLENKLNEIISSVNRDIHTEFKETEGKPGDIRVFPNANQTYSLEACTDEGWKKMFASNYTTEDGTSEVYLDDKPKNTTPKKITHALDARYIPAAPDYDSGWFEVELGKQYVTGATTGVAPDASFVYDAAEVVGIPALGFTLTSPPRHYQILLTPPGASTFDDIDTHKFLSLQNEGKFYISSGGSQYSVGYSLYMTSKTSVVLAGPGNHHFLWGGSSDTGGVNDLNTNETYWYQAFTASGTSAGTGTVRLLLWK